MATSSALEQAMEAGEEDFSPQPYEITASPNDFNVATLYDFITSGVVKIPGFQRHYVWDIKRASKLIESLLLGLPVPQIFLYEADKDSFLVIDGQQRLMTLYYFREGRFPVMDRRADLRRIFDQSGRIPQDVLQDPQYFTPFELKLPKRSDGSRNEFHGLCYQTLGPLKTSFDIKTIRNVIIKQLQPRGDMSSIYEIFSRLNSEGVNLERQELRTCLYHSHFLSMLGRINDLPGWRRLLDEPAPDVHMRDIQFLLRALGLLCQPYAPSMSRFLDRFADAARKFDDAEVGRLERLFESFLVAADPLPASALRGQGGAFSITLFEAVFVGACSGANRQGAEVAGELLAESIKALSEDQDFVQASTYSTTSTVNVNTRLDAGRRHVRLV